MKKISTFHLFLTITSVSFIISILYLMVTRGAALDTYVALQGKDHYMDFFNHIRYVENPRDTYFVIKDACFPPLAYLFYFALNRILPTAQATGTTWEVVQPYAMLMFVIYMCVLTILLYHCLGKILSRYSSSQVLLFMLSIILSNAFIFWVTERGNAAYIVAVLLLAFYAMKDSESKVKREIAMILLAVAACFKLYPALFGLLYLAEKRYKEAIRLIIYGVTFFLLPFVFFGGFDGLIQFFRNQVEVQASCYVAITSIYAICRKFIVDADIALKVYACVALIFAVSALAILFFSKLEKFKKYYLICALIMFLPMWNGGYTTVYMLLPLAIFLQENREKVVDKLYSVAFAVIFIFMTYKALIWEVAFGEFWIYCSMYLLTVVFLVQGIISIVKRISSRKELVEAESK